MSGKVIAQPKLTCTPKSLPRSKVIAAAEHAARINPANHPPVERMMGLARNFTPNRMSIALLTTKYWGSKGVKLSVGFLDGPPVALRRRILSHMNAWGKSANVSFTEGKDSPDVRIARQSGRDGGYWSYLGTDIHHISSDEPTMNLEGFTMEMPESEFVRVVRHETGHTLGFPHEHMRRELVAKIDREKAIAFFMRTQGWTRQDVIAQVLTPIEESSLRGTAHADPRSIMCYQIPGRLTKDGKPILGGTDIDTQDAAFAALIYPKKVSRARPAKPRPTPRRRRKSRTRSKRSS